MKIFFLRFFHIVLKIFEQLDDKNLKNCREVSKKWKIFIDNHNLLWTRIVDIPTKLNDRNTYLHVAAKTGQKVIFEFIEKSEIVKNPQNDLGQTPFHFVCGKGHLKIAEMLLNRSVEIKFSLSVKWEEAMSNGHPTKAHNISEQYQV